MSHYFTPLQWILMQLVYNEGLSRGLPVAEGEDRLRGVMVQSALARRDSDALIRALPMADPNGPEPISQAEQDERERA